MALPPEGQYQTLGAFAAVAHGTAARQLLGLARVGKMCLVEFYRSHRKAGIVLGKVPHHEGIGAGQGVLELRRRFVLRIVPGEAAVLVAVARRRAAMDRRTTPPYRLDVDIFTSP